jgi:hypothetical protein
MYGRSCIVLVYTKVHLQHSYIKQRKVEIAMEFHKENERKEHEECTLIYLF